MPQHPEALDAAVRSIYGFIRRTAEPTPTGTCWETVDYENHPHRDPGVFNGVGGISFFLVDAYRRLGEAEALDLAQGAIDWCIGFRGPHYRRGLHFGQTGAALAALHKSIALDEPEVPAFCRENAAVILDEAPGPVTDLIGGEASNGLYLLKLWARTQEDAYRRGAERCAAWLAQQMSRDARGTHCPADPQNRLGFGPSIHLGVAHGLAGIAHFLALRAVTWRVRSVSRWRRSPSPAPSSFSYVGNGRLHRPDRNFGLNNGVRFPGWRRADRGPLPHRSHQRVRVLSTNASIS